MTRFKYYHKNKISLIRCEKCGKRIHRIKYHWPRKTSLGMERERRRYISSKRMLNTQHYCSVECSGYKN